VSVLVPDAVLLDLLRCASAATDGARESVVADLLEEAGDPRAAVFRAFATGRAARPGRVGAGLAHGSPTSDTSFQLSCICRRRKGGYREDLVEVRFLACFPEEGRAQEWSADLTPEECRPLAALLRPSEVADARRRFRVWRQLGWVSPGFFARVFGGDHACPQSGGPQS
jgi:hypothetical protein